MTRKIAGFLIVLAWSGALTTQARADTPAPEGVVDNEVLFRPEIVHQADTMIRAMRKYHVDVRIETLALSEEERLAIEKLPRQRNQAEYFIRLADQRAEKANVKGLYILICLNPRYIQVSAYPESMRTLFSRHICKEIHDLLQQKLRGVKPGAGRSNTAEVAVGFAWRVRPATGPDAGLLDALHKVDRVLVGRAGSPNSVSAAVLAGILLTGVTIWLLLLLAQQRLSKVPGQASTSGQPDRSAAMLAARFGSLAALWAYDRLFYGPPATPSTAETVVSAPLHPEDGYTTRQVSSGLVQTDLYREDERNKLA